MSSSKKSEALVRDLAKLVAVYPASAWKPVLEELARGGEGRQRLVREVEAVLSQISNRPNTAVRKSGRPPLAREPRSTLTEPLIYQPGRADVLAKLEAAIASKDFLRTASELRRAYITVGGKNDLPRERQSAARTLLKHLDGLPDAAFGAAVEALGRHAPADSLETYTRWFALIRQSGGGPA